MSTISKHSQKAQFDNINKLDDPPQWPSTIPPHHHLLVTTPKGVYTWDSHGATEVFRSDSQGVVAAKQAKNGSGLLAVADSHIVVLYDVKKGMNNSYRLKDSNGQVRMLRYSRDSNNLYFTTSLCNSVQAYSTKQSKLLGPYNTHPTPPTVFALSSTSNLLLSASSSPIVIQVTNLMLNTRPVMLRPQCSLAKVAAAEFHPERGNIFILAFGDGSIAAYDASSLFRDNERGERRPGISTESKIWEISHIKRLHATGNTISMPTHTSSPDLGNDPTTGNVSIGDKSLGVTAVAFVPGSKAIAISIGSDERCCLVDFAASTNGEAALIRSWHVKGPGTCLSILPLDNKAFSGLPESRHRANPALYQTAVAAIGQQDGRIVVFDLDGQQLGEQIINQFDQIIDIEWMTGDEQPELTTSVAKPPNLKRKSLGSVLAGGRSVAEEVISIIDEADTSEESRNALLESLRKLETSTQPTNGQISPVPALGHLEFFSPVKALSPQDPNYDDTSGKADSSSIDSVASSPRGVRTLSHQLLKSSAGLAQADGPLELVIAQSHEALEVRQTQQVRSVSSMTDELQAKKNKQSTASPKSRSSKGLGLLTSHMPKKVLSIPRKPSFLRIESKEPPAGTEFPAPGHLEDVWTDIATDDGLRSDHETLASRYGKKEGRVVLLTPIKPDTLRGSNQPQLENAEMKWLAGDALGTNGDGTSQQKRWGRDKSDQITQKPDKGSFDIYDDNDGDFPSHISLNYRSPLAEITPNTRRSTYRSPAKQFHSPRRGVQIRSRDQALALRIHKEVMKEVGAEVKALRKEMRWQFVVQKKWFEKQLRESQEWTLRVEEENRKLRGEIARERKRGERAEGWRW
ncbi:MAG: hypothetical protein Q9167_000969 [Letrouitia subvulpina]